MIRGVTLGNWAVCSRPVVFGHRGGRGLAPENTLAAFDRGVKEGLDGLELDVRLTRDGEVVACHDATIDRTTDGSGPVARYSLAELSAVDAGYRFEPAPGQWPFRGCGVRLPTLREILARYQDCALIVELKDDEVELARAAVKLIREAGAVDRVCIGSFRTAVLREVRKLEPRLATGASGPEVRLALYASWFRLFPRRPAYRAMQVPVRREGHRVASPRLIRLSHRAGVPVHVWTVNEPDAMRTILSWGADAIITDFPDIAVPTVRDWVRTKQGSGCGPM